MAETATAAFEQPESFAFDAESQAEIATTIAKYPAGKQASGVLPLLNYTPEEVCAWGCVPFTQLHSAAQCAAIKAAARLSQQPVSPSPDP